MRQPISTYVACLIVLLASAIAAGARQPGPDTSDARAMERIACGRASIGPVASLVSLSVTGTRQSMIETAPGTDRPAELHFILPDKFLRLVSVLLPTHEIRRLASGVNGTTLLNGPRGSLSGGQGGVQGDPAAERRAFWRLLLGWLLIEPSSVRFTYTYAGDAEAPNGQRAVLVDVAGPDDFAVRLFLDGASCRPLMLTYATEHAMGLSKAPGASRGETIRRLSRSDSLVVTTTFFSDVRPVGAFRLPHVTIESQGGRTVQQFRAERFVVNPQLKPVLFAVP
jgi:hypothetical protein